MPKKHGLSDQAIRRLRWRLLCLAGLLWTATVVGSLILFVKYPPLISIRFLGAITYSRLFTVLMLIPIALILLKRRQHRAVLHREVAGANCSRCGYAMEGLEPNPGSQLILCPECGQPHFSSGEVRTKLKLQPLRTRDVAAVLPWPMRVFSWCHWCVQQIEKSYRENPSVLIGCVVGGYWLSSGGGSFWSNWWSSIDLMGVIFGIGIWLTFYVLAELTGTLVAHVYRQLLNTRFRNLIETRLAR